MHGAPFLISEGAPSPSAMPTKTLSDPTALLRPYSCIMLIMVPSLKGSHSPAASMCLLTSSSATYDSHIVYKKCPVVPLEGSWMSTICGPLLM